MSRYALVVLLLLLVPLGAGCSHAHVATCASEIHKAAPVTNRGTRAATGATLTVDAANAAFAPTCFDDVPRGAVTLRVRNTGKSLHNVQATAQHVDVDVAPGHTIVVHLRIADAPVVYVCKYHRSLGMVGVLVPAR
jgi:plastocyanin